MARPKVYPFEMKKYCSYCGNEKTVLIKAHRDRIKKTFCSDTCKEMARELKLAKKIDACTTVSTPRRDINSIPGPTKYERQL